MKSINELCKEVHETAIKRGFYENDDKLGRILADTGMGDYALSMRICQLLLLICSELKEAMEADRNNKYCKIEILKEMEVLGDSGFQIAYLIHIKDTFEDEIAGALVRIFDICGFLSIDLESHIAAAMRYNELREPKHGKKY